MFPMRATHQLSLVEISVAGLRLCLSADGTLRGQRRVQNIIAVRVKSLKRFRSAVFPRGVKTSELLNERPLSQAILGWL